MKQHRNSRYQLLRNKPDGKRGVTGYVVWNNTVLGLELRANAHLQRRNVPLNTCTIHVNPPLTVIKFEDHGRIAAGCDDSVRGRLLAELVAFQELRTACTVNAILPVKNVRGPAVGIPNGIRIPDSFDCTAAFLAVVAIADGADNRSTNRFEFDASA